MARRRRVNHEGIDPFADDRVESWLTDADRDAVAAVDRESLASVVGGLHAGMRLTTIPAGQALSYFLGDPKVVNP